MALSKEQKALLRAVREVKISRVRELLDDGVDPDFPFGSVTTPLHEAAKNPNLILARLLTAKTMWQMRPNLNRLTKDGKTPLDIAEEYGNWDVADYLESKGAKHGNEVAINSFLSSRKKQTMKKGGTQKSSARNMPSGDAADAPVFKPETLADEFNAAKWTGKVDKMQEHWKKVPSRLKKKFDFEAALNEARMQTLKTNTPKKSILNKNLPPPVPPAG